MAFFFGLFAGYAFLITGTIYYPIGIHFGWNVVESIIFSQKVFSFQVHDVMLAGQRMITPDRQGLVGGIVMIVAAVAYMGYYRVWRLSKIETLK